MAKVREVYVEAKKSRSYQTYTFGQNIVIEDGDDVDAIIKEHQARCRKLVNNQIELDTGSRP